MKFTFDYEETLTRRVIIEANNLPDAIKEITRRIDEQEIVLDSTDFMGGQITMPLAENFLPQVLLCGESVENKEDMDILIDSW